jgi:uncharacterized protein YndB with AHSA1/START domain
VQGVARTETVIQAPPELVWAVLADPEAYPRWLVGAAAIRDADPAFPAPGTRFHHRVGFGPLKVNDHTEVVEAQAPRRLVLRAKARPLGTALVTFELASMAGGATHVTMLEGPADAFSRLFHNPVTDVLLRGRNVESLRRLRELAEARAQSDPGAA